jgi:hypothetical protein
VRGIRVAASVGLFDEAAEYLNYSRLALVPALTIKLKAAEPGSCSIRQSTRGIFASLRQLLKPASKLQR